jgi:putative ABC transport system permease protein
MTWFYLAFKNLIRRRTRTVLTVLGVAIAIAVLYSLFQFQQGYQQRLRAELGALGAHVMVVPKGCPYEAATIALHGGKWPRYMDEELLATVKADPGVEQAAGILMDAVFLPDGRNVILVGIDEDYAKMRPAWQVEGAWFDADSAVILGATVAEAGRLRPGDWWTLPGKETRLRVAGVLRRTKTQDDGFVFLPRRTLQQFSELEGKLVVILVKARAVERTDELVASLRAQDVNMNVFPLTELLNTIGDLIASTRVFVTAVIIIAVLIGAVGVLNTVLMAVFERTREIGMMKAMGAGRADVFRLIWAETVLVTIFGGLVGVGIALVSSRLVEAFIRASLPFAPAGSLISFSLPTLLFCVGLSLVLGLVAGFYPAWRAARVSPVEAIKAD